MTGAVAATLLGGVMAGAPAILAGPSGTVGGVQVTQAAEAASWIPTKPSSPQPVGWGSVCAKVKLSDGRTTEYRWWTTSAGGSTCLAYRTYR